MKKLSDQAAEFMQETYRETYEYSSKRLIKSFRGLVITDKSNEEPLYKDSLSKEEYTEELIETMNYLHEKTLLGEIKRC